MPKYLSVLNIQKVQSLYSHVLTGRMKMFHSGILRLPPLVTWSAPSCSPPNMVSLSLDVETTRSEHGSHLCIRFYALYSTKTVGFKKNKNSSFWIMKQWLNSDWGSGEMFSSVKIKCMVLSVFIHFQEGK